jgi:tetratricopeptide (TPR) repeat protein
LLSYDRALSLRPSFAATLNNRGNLLQDLGRADEALADYESKPSTAAAARWRS